MLFCAQTDLIQVKCATDGYAATIPSLCLPATVIIYYLRDISCKFETSMFISSSLSLLTCLGPELNMSETLTNNYLP